MKCILSVWLAVCLCVCLKAASPAGDVPANGRSAEEVARTLSASRVVRSDIEILESARAANDDVYSSLQSFVCREEMNRFKGSLNGQKARALDTVTAKLSFERGVEQYSEIQQNSKPREEMSNLPGAWSEGEFGTLLLQTQQLLGKERVVFDSFEEFKGEAAALYHFDVTAEKSPWDLSVGGRHYRLAFRTRVWISVESGEILRIERVASSLAAETRISGIEWGITLEHFSMDGKSWLLPATGSYAVSYQEAKQRDWNLIGFSGYQHCGAEAALRLE